MGILFGRLTRNVLLLAVAIFGFTLFSRGEVSSYEFVRHDTSALWLDVYQPEQAVRKDICVVYVFGGGFINGSRLGNQNVRFFNILMARGYTVVAIDYRLGLKRVEKVGALHPKPGFRAVAMATEDLISATDFILKNREKLRVDPERIVLIGSSAGAITVLQADYERANRTELGRVLPEDFRYAGVVSLAGAIFSTEGRPSYTKAPRTDPVLPRNQGQGCGIQ